MVKTSVNVVFFTGDGSVELLVNRQVSGVNAAITNHFVMLFGDMADEAFDKFHDRNGFFDISIIFVPVVMEGNKVTVVFINPGSGDHGTPQITSDVFYHGFRVAFVWFGIDIETVFVFLVTAGFYLFKGRSDFGFHFIQEGSAEGITEEGIVKVVDIPPKTIITVTTLRNKAVDVWVPFQVPAKGVKDHDETGSKVQGFILLKKHA